jgi:hypothetical protein
MKDYKELNDLLNDLVEALEKQDNNFSRKILEFLHKGPEFLIKEYREHPGARLVANNGNWMSLWAGGVMIDGKLVSYKQVIEKIRNLQVSENGSLKDKDV